MKSGGLNDGYPQFYDFDVDMAAREVHTASELPATKQAEQLINRMEFHRTVFDSDERNLIMNHAYKLDNMADTTALAYSIAEQKDDISLLMETENMAQAEIDALPDGMIGLSEMHEYGYTWNEMLPLTKEKALELFEHDLPLYVLHEDGSETTVEDKTQIQEHEGIFGIERGDWENERNLRAMQEELSENEAGKETQLLYGNTDKYGIYQLKDNPELRPFHFAGTEALKRMGITKDNFDAVNRRFCSYVRNANSNIPKFGTLF